MSISRRGFLGSILAAASAPAIIKAENAMKLWVPSQEIVRLNPEGIAPIMTVISSMAVLVGDVLADHNNRTFLVIERNANRLTLADVSGNAHAARLIPPGPLKHVGN